MIRLVVDFSARIAILALMIGHVAEILHFARSDLNIVFVPVILYWLFGNSAKRAANGYGHRYWGRVPWPNIDYVEGWGELVAVAAWSILTVIGIHLIPFVLTTPETSLVISLFLFGFGFLVFIVSRINVGRRVDDND